MEITVQSTQNPMSGQCMFKVTRKLGDKSVKRVSSEPHVSVIQCGEKHHLEADKYKYNSRFMQQIDSSVSTRLVTTWLSTVTEFVASPVEDLG